MNISMYAISERQRAHFYLYKKQNKMRNDCIYKNQDTLQKERKIPLRLYIQKA